MEIQDAASLLNNQELKKKNTWADLGSGNGVFTLALASLLQPGSTIHAIDKDNAALKKIPALYQGVQIIHQPGDFTEDALPSGLDGILMANSLHYVKDQLAFIQHTETSFRKNYYWLLVEYDSGIPNPWVPYPLSFKMATDLFGKAGYTAEKLGERASLYGRARIYSAVFIK